MKICVIIPAHNESLKIGEIVSQMKRKKLSVVVIDDGSNDNSGAIASQNGAFVIPHKEKQGKGVSLCDGFNFAVKNDFNGVITMDGDGQHSVSDIDVLLEVAFKHQPCLVTGNRMNNTKDMPWMRWLANRVTSYIISSICRQNIPDTQCGFRFVSIDILKCINLKSSDFEIESEVLIEASKKGFKIYSVPIQTIYRDESSKINPLVDTIRFFVYVIKESLSSKSSKTKR